MFVPIFKNTLMWILLAVVIAMSACVSDVPPGNDLEQIDDWKDVELTDVATGSTFRISDFEGKPVLVESFAVWCPTCKRQQDEVKELHRQVGDAVVSISLDTDPNEDENRVKEHIQLHGYEWYFAVSPPEVTQKLIDEFGVTVVNAPSVPIILVCEDQSTRFLKSGVKSADTLKEEIEKGC